MIGFDHNIWQAECHGELPRPNGWCPFSGILWTHESTQVLWCSWVLGQGSLSMRYILSMVSLSMFSLHIWLWGGQSTKRLNVGHLKLGAVQDGKAEWFESDNNGYISTQFKAHLNKPLPILWKSSNSIPFAHPRKYHEVHNLIRLNFDHSFHSSLGVMFRITVS